MHPGTLTARSLAWYWRTHAAVVVGVAAAVAVLTGALLVGDSVQGSLRDLVLLRLGRTDLVVISTGFVREALAGEIRDHPEFSAHFEGIAPIVLTEGFLRTQTGDGGAGLARVYGVDERFWRFHGLDALGGPEGRQAFLSPSTASGLGVVEGDTILVRVQRPTDIPLESVYGRKDDLGQTVRATVRAILPREELGEFSLEATQGDVSAVFLPLALLQDELDIGERVSALLVSATDDGTEAADALERMVRDRASPEDLGLRLRMLGATNALALESGDGLLRDAVIEAAREVRAALDLDAQPVFTYLANTIESGGREIPYSLVAATDLSVIAPALEIPENLSLPPVVLTDWAAGDLGVGTGDEVSLEYYLWEDPGRLLARTARFAVAGVVPVERGDPDLAPDYPGISDSPDLDDWDPPFPIDLARIRPIDEQYWDRYTTTPKAYIPTGVGQQLWQSRHGSLTSIRFAAPPGVDPAPEARVRAELGARIDPFGAGLAIANVRAQGLEASGGAVNFGEYFVYFSFFLVVSALLLAALFFKLSVEQRAAEIGLLRAVGFTPGAVRRSFMREGLWLSLLGAGAGVAGGVAYARIIVAALGTWWVGAVGTTRLTLHVSPLSLTEGVVGGIVAALACIWITLGGLSRVSERRLLAGQLASEAQEKGGSRTALGTTLALLAGAVLLIALTMGGLVPDAGGFFGAGTALLAGCLAFFVYGSRRPTGRVLDGRGPWPLARLGMRNVTWRPARSVVSMAMIASATFILISVDAFRTDAIYDSGPRSGIGGYSLIVETLLPIVYDPESSEGRDALGIDGFDPIRVEAFRHRPGDDASCLNLYAPQNPRIIAPSDTFIEDGRFRFGDSLASTPAESANPWLLLEELEPDGAIPVIADTHSITYVLDRSLGDDIVIAEGDRELRLRLVAALEDSIFQGELLMSEANFRSAFPDQAGYSYFLVETDAAQAESVREALGDALEDHGARITPAAERLAAFHQVENTYLSTFQALGALGLLLGTVGLGAVLLRNVLERRRELALLRALGYRQYDFMKMAAAENAFLLAGGLVAGAISALLAIAPAVAERGGRLPGTLLLVLLSGVLALGLITSILATIAALRSPLLDALRSE